MSHSAVLFPELSQTLKRLLKAKKITYRELSRRLKISESSMKKTFIAQDCSLSRLNEICRALDISLADLIASAADTKPEKFHFTPYQEEFLTKNRKIFHIYWKLTIENLTLAEIQKQFGISEQALFKMLRSLDQMGLIELLPDNKVRYPDKRMVLWSGDGPLLKMVRTEWAPLITKRAGENLGKSTHALSVRHFTLLPESIQDFHRAMDDLHLEFGRRSLRESEFSNQPTERLFHISAFSPSSYVEEL